MRTEKQSFVGSLWRIGVAWSRREEDRSLWRIGELAQLLRRGAQKRNAETCGDVPRAEPRSSGAETCGAQPRSGAQKHAEPRNGGAQFHCSLKRLCIISGPRGGQGPGWPRPWFRPWMQQQYQASSTSNIKLSNGTTHL